MLFLDIIHALHGVTEIGLWWVVFPRSLLLTTNVTGDQAKFRNSNIFILKSKLADLYIKEPLYVMKNLNHILRITLNFNKIIPSHTFVNFKPKEFKRSFKEVSRKGYFWKFQGCLNEVSKHQTPPQSEWNSKRLHPLYLYPPWTFWHLPPNIFSGFKLSIDQIILDMKFLFVQNLIMQILWNDYFLHKLFAKLSLNFN